MPKNGNPHLLAVIIDSGFAPYSATLGMYGSEWLFVKDHFSVAVLIPVKFDPLSVEIIAPSDHKGIVVVGKQMKA